MISLKVRAADPQWSRITLLAEELIGDTRACDTVLRYWFGPAVNAHMRRMIVAALAAIDKDHPRMMIMAIGLNIQIELTND